MLDDNGFGIAVAVLTIMIAVGGMAFGVGYAMNSRRLKDFGREELEQCIVNGALIGIFFTLFLPSGPISSLISSVTTGLSAQCPGYMAANSAMCFSYAYLSGSGYYLDGVSHASILTQSTDLIIGLFSINGILGLIGSLNVNVFGVGLSLTQVMAPILFQLQFMIKALSTVVASVLIQSSILAAISIVSVAVLLPLGVILRTFYPTRRLGGFLIGTVIGLYVVLPLTYVLDASVLNSYSAGISNSTIVNMTNSATSLNSYLSNSSILSEISGSALTGIEDASKSVISAFSYFANAMMGYLSYLVLAAFVLPGFSLAMTYVSIKEFSSLLGSEISFNLLDVV